MTRILCLSDMHFDANKVSGVYSEDRLDNEEFLESINTRDPKHLLLEAIRNEEEPFDLIVYCGDCIDGPGGTQSFNGFQEFMTDIRGTGKVSLRGPHDDVRNHIVVAPGNHDVDRRTKEGLESFKRVMNEYLTPYRVSSDSFQNAPTYVFDDYKLIITCETTAENCATENQEVNRLIKKLEEEKGLAEENCSDTISQVIGYLDKRRINDIPTITKASEKRFLENATEIEDDNVRRGYTKVLVTHHPLLSSVEDGVSVKPYSETVGGFSFMQTCINFGYSFFVHGHLHQCSCIEVINHDVDIVRPAYQIGVPQMNVSKDVPAALLLEIEEGKPFQVIALSIDFHSHKFKEIRNLVATKRAESYANIADRILIDRDIEQIINEGKVIKNADLKNVEAASYDCALGDYYKKIDANMWPTDWKDVPIQSVELNADEQSCIHLEPDETILIFSYEEFDVPDNMILHASPISSLIRQGLRVEISHFVDPGFKGNFSFPVTNVTDHSISIKSGDPILSIEFVLLGEPVEKGWSERHPSETIDRRGYRE